MKDEIDDYVYIVKYSPNIEEDYILYISHDKKKCEKFIEDVKSDKYNYDYLSDEEIKNKHLIEYYDWQAEDMYIKELKLNKILYYE